MGDRAQALRGVAWSPPGCSLGWVRGRVKCVPCRGFLSRVWVASRCCFKQWDRHPKWSQRVAQHSPSRLQVEEKTKQDKAKQKQVKPTKLSRGVTEEVASIFPA